MNGVGVALGCFSAMSWLQEYVMPADVRLQIAGSTLQAMASVGWLVFVIAHTLERGRRFASPPPVPEP